MNVGKKHKLARPYEKLGIFLKAARKEAGLTQRFVSEALGYSSPQFVSNAECGISSIPLHKMAKLRKLYNLDCVELANRIVSDERSIILDAISSTKKLK